MHKNLLLCTAACALFFSSFTFTSTSIASSLSPEIRRPLEGITKLPEQYRYAIDFINTPTQAKKNREKIASGTMAEANASFNQEHQKNSETSLTHTENKHPVINSSTRQKRSSDPLPPANVVSQHKNTSSLRAVHEITQPEINKNLQSDIDPKTNTSSSTSEMSPNTSAKAHVKLLSKVDSTAITDPQSSSQLTDGKATASSSSLDEIENSKTLTPQIENSLIMPIAMFSVGVADANNQSTLLDNMQITMFEPKNYQERGIFLSTYGNKNTFFSRIQTEQDNVQTEQDSVQTEQVEVQAERDEIQEKQEDVQTEQESVHADIRYAALQAGAILIAREYQSISTNFGFFGTYGKLSFAPKNAESSHKKMFDKWSLTAYGNIQHDSGAYASAFLSYGIFKENMANNFIKDTPKMNNSKILGAAATVGQKLLTSFEGVILEPQAQLVYQHLMLGSSSDNNSSSNDSSPSDEDTSKINISKPDQWLVRIGGRLTQNKGHALSFYGKLNLIKTFSKNFQLAAMGSLVEGGFGVHAHLSQNIELHSDLSYQHKFKKVGISGINISAGMRYHF
ncbi:autotransporter outer membrane beta-barrel domain-containing protein [Bartonella queenslandensis]|uniref:autotransporter outer membrane beta-barrel domain-containing protein n=1 Tax=Bartonella queenslandensis TaxID=481138 RepID=UPI001BACD593|nr:autotransporter outer membrane beta-barrel domain-containing protein [Bartonella queenslandensis]